MMFVFSFFVCASLFFTTYGNYHESRIVYSVNITGKPDTNTKVAVFKPSNTTNTDSTNQTIFELPLHGNGEYGLNLTFSHDHTTRYVTVRLNAQHKVLENFTLAANYYAQTVPIRFSVANENLFIYGNEISYITNNKTFVQLDGLNKTEAVLSEMVLIKYNNNSCIPHHINTNHLIGETYQILIKKFDDLQKEMSEIKKQHLANATDSGKTKFLGNLFG
jgi:hypothetical protein